MSKGAFHHSCVTCKSAPGWDSCMSLTSKNADCSLAQKPRARISSHASGALFAPLGSISPVASWNVSTHRLQNVSLKISISLYHWIIYPPRIQIKAWSASNKSPQTRNVKMSLNSQKNFLKNSQPYLNLIAFLNFLLLRVKFIYIKYITLSQLETPFSFKNSTARWVFKDRDFNSRVF